MNVCRFGRLVRLPLVRLIRSKESVSRVQAPQINFSRNLLLRSRFYCSTNENLTNASISKVEFSQILEGLFNDSMVVIDVRDASELINPGRIPGTKNIPLADIEDAFTNLSAEEFFARYDFKKPAKNKTFVLTSQTGKRGHEAAMALNNLGYSVAVYPGGILDWSGRGGKVCTGVKTIGFEEVERNIEEKSKILIDVRMPAERKKSGVIPGSVNIPLLEIPKAFKLDADKFKSQYGFEKPQKNSQIVFHCVAGIRATTASDMLALLEYENVQVYKGSFNDWKVRGGKILTVDD